MTMRRTAFAALCGLCLVVVSACDAAHAQSPDCRVEPFSGAAMPQGADTTMRLVNTGKTCTIINFGVGADRSNPAQSGTITKPPAHGKAEFKPPRAAYTPEPGYVGEDAFEYEAFARGQSNQPVRLLVRVKVTVTAP